MEFLRALDAPPGKFIDLTAKTMALQTGIGSQTISKTLNTLRQQDRIAFKKGPNGRDIVGIKIIDLEPRAKGRQAATVKAADKHKRQRRVTYAQPVEVMPAQQRRNGRNGLHTPAIDQYARAKADFARIQSDLGDYIEATFKPNAIADEALMVRERLTATEAALIELRMTHEAMEREHKGLLARKREALSTPAEAKAVEAAIEETAHAAN